MATEKIGCYRLSTLEDVVKSNDMDPAVESLLSRQLPLWQKNNKSVEDHFSQYSEKLKQVMESLADATATVSKLQGIISESRRCVTEHGQLLEKLARHELPSGKVDDLMASASKQGLSPQLLMEANVSFMKVKQVAEDMMRCVEAPAAAPSPNSSNLGSRRSLAGSRTTSLGSVRSSLRSAAAAAQDLRFDDLEAGYLSGRGFSISEGGKRATWGKYRGAIVCDGRIGVGIHSFRFRLTAGDWEHAAFGLAAGADCSGGVASPYAFWWGQDVHVKLSEAEDEKVLASTLKLTSLAAGDVMLVSIDRTSANAGRVMVRAERTGDTQVIEFDAHCPLTPCFAMWKGVIDICDPPMQSPVFPTQ